MKKLMGEFTPHPERHGCKAVDEWRSGGIPPHGRKTEKSGATGVSPWGSTNLTAEARALEKKIEEGWGKII